MASPQQYRCLLFSEDGKMLTALDSNKRADILEYCYERFGIMETVFENYNWYIGSKNRIYIGPEEIERLVPESIGLCIFRLDKTPKPTTNFIQLFGKEITKNIISLDRNQTLAFCGGSDLEIINNVEPGFVSINYKNISLGCGHWNGEILKNQIPKSRFCKINFL